MMNSKKYFIKETSEVIENHAGWKARQDIEEIARMNRWIPIDVRRQFKNTTLEKMKASYEVFFDWRKVFHMVPANSILLVQYPLATFQKISILSLHWLQQMKKKGIKLVMLIHDLEELHLGVNNLDTHFLRLADIIICHNRIMKQYLSEKYSVPILSIEIFDYLISDRIVLDDTTKMHSIDIAGNLSPTKAGYIYKLYQSFPRAHFNLYGPNFLENSEEKIWYRGSFPPSQLIEQMHGQFGLVWDGASIDSCTGESGSYLKYNNPHKMSLYLAAAKPVLIWEQAAQAQFVEDHNIGVVCSSIGAGLKEIYSLSEAKIKSMQQATLDVSRRIREGYYTSRVLDQSLSLL
ncbi:hypothetical protein [Scardovia inopinata]|nr:hypothetical protein [Scardovia inopinata]BAR06154.1 putative glycosyltransferase [Scardovia inopinata JCM 12537]